MAISSERATPAYFPDETDKPVEINNEYDAGQEIARRYIKKHGKTTVGKLIDESTKSQGLAELNSLTPPEGVDSLYRVFDIQTMVRASQGFVDYLSNHKVFNTDDANKNLAEQRRAKMKFSADWLRFSPNTNFSEMQSKNPKE